MHTNLWKDRNGTVHTLQSQGHYSKDKRRNVGFVKHCLDAIARDAIAMIWKSRTRVRDSEGPDECYSVEALKGLHTKYLKQGKKAEYTSIDGVHIMAVLSNHPIHNTLNTGCIYYILLFSR